MLEELVVERAPRKSLAEPNTEFISLPKLFGGSLPARSLRKLHILNICFLPRFSGPSILTELEICQNFVADRILPVRDLIEFLRQCPLLEKALIAGIPLEGPPIFPDFIAPLPRLKHLGLRSSEGFVSQILAHLYLPRSTKIHLTTRYSEPGGTGYDMIPRDMEATLPCLTGFKRLELAFDEARFTLRAFHTPDQYVDPALEVSVLVPSDTDVTFSEFLYDWPFDVSQVESLVMSGPSLECPNMLGTAIRELFRDLSNLTLLRAVSMNKANAVALVHWLSRDLGPREPNCSQEDRSVPHTLLPKLSVLEFCDIENGMSLAEPVYRTIGLRRNGGKLKEVNMFLVDGWDQCLARAITATSGNGVTVTMDNGEE
ncbi:hypothetical protein BV20DRAFT_805965 [Pilatotrama ljubarskyi]|nr:hypothetical protein BV20DRAFT_805965 [Pilatotrama ljubarskyi]